MEPKNEYLQLLKKVLTHSLWPGEYVEVGKNKSKTLKYFLIKILISLFKAKDIKLVRYRVTDDFSFIEGRGWPSNAETMIGIKRLDNIEFCINQILKNNIPGDFIETGVWRGGATIFMKAMLKINEVDDRIVWVADSFEGLPKPDETKYPADKGDKHHTINELQIGLEQVKHNFSKYSLLDDNVRFLKGWFKDTLPVAPVINLALLRIDGDMYESTMDALKNLYPKLSIGGYVIIDDFLNESCVKAVEDYRKMHEITEPIIEIDWTGVFWQKKK